MQVMPLKMLDLTLYKEKLDNGLEIYVLPKENCNNIYASFNTRYGSVQSEFVPLGMNKMTKVPDGIAHFLEHKLFEQENGIEPFAFFDETGSECNASTSYYKTSYWFSGTNYFKKNLNYLLDFVQQPHFTDKNVEKEKGIIEQEIDMYKDHPYRVAFEKSYENVLKNHPIRIGVAGSKESINKITKEDLYTCYNTFYHPSNMFVFVSGNINPEETIDIIKKNQCNKKFKDVSKIEVKDYKEPDEVLKKEEIIKLNVTIPKIFLNYKINIKDIDFDVRFILNYLSLFLDIKFGSTSLFLEKLKQNKILNDDIYFSTLHVDNHIIITIEGETDKIDTFIEEIEKEIKNKKTNEIDFVRKSKTILSSCIFMSDNLDRISGKLISDIIKYDQVFENMYDEYKSLNYNDFKKIIDNIMFNIKSTLIIEPK